MGVSGRRGTIEAIPQKRERDWTIVCYQGNYLFIQTEYVNFPEQRKETAARSCSAVSFCSNAKISENHENLQFPC